MDANIHSETPTSEEEPDSRERSAAPSSSASRSGSRGPREKPRVQFNSSGESLDTLNQRATFDLRDNNSAPSHSVAFPSHLSSFHLGRPHGRRTATSLSHASSSAEERARKALTSHGLRSARSSSALSTIPSGRSDIGASLDQAGWGVGPSQVDGEDDGFDDDPDENGGEKAESQKDAQKRARRLSKKLGIKSAPISYHALPSGPAPRSPPPSPPPGEKNSMPIDLKDIPLEKLQSKRTRYGINDESEDDSEDEGNTPTSRRQKILKFAKRLAQSESDWRHGLFKKHIGDSPLHSGQVTPTAERDPFHYVPRPQKYRAGYLSTMMKLYDERGDSSAHARISGNYDITYNTHAKRDSIASNASTSSLPAEMFTGSSKSDNHTPSPSPLGSPQASGLTSPKAKHEKWYYKNQASASTGSITDLIRSSTMLAQASSAKEQSTAMKPTKSKSTQALDAVFGKKKTSPRPEDSIKIHIHIDQTIKRHKYILKMCHALMTYGAPTHRMEEYMSMSARVLEISGQFLYMPGCMIISFDDPGTHTTEVKLVRTAQDVNLGKLLDTHEVYKEVVHDKIRVTEAIDRLNEIVRRKDQYGRWLRVLFCGFASASVGPFAFGARPIDLPIAFFLGSLLGWMQLILAPKSVLYANIFEISAAVLTSFAARGFGSIKGGIFCFSALAQSAIALILPGYTVLCASLELQSKNIVAGSVRMVYAIIYSLFLGFGITIGTSFYGWADGNATSSTTCDPAWPLWWKIIFVPPFTFCLIVINQAQMKQAPVMLAIALTGWVVNHFTAERFPSNAQIANTLGAFAIGLLGNMYSRLRHGLAAAALIPAIFVQVPSGLAASGSLVSGVVSADQITDPSNHGGVTTVANGTQAGSGGVNVNSAVLNVGYSMIQVAIGITVGLFLSSLVIYPLGKRRSGLFSF